MSQPSRKETAYDSFANVDKVVNKPIMGSDGAASWQSFRNDVGYRGSVAPSLQVKKSDRLGTGFTNVEEERAHDNKIRKAAGDAEVGAGYVNFKRKITAEDAKLSKENKRIQERQRPADKEYFIQSGGEFKGYKYDYIFTTRDGRTGYYWDGTDSIKKLSGIDTEHSDIVCQVTAENSGEQDHSTAEKPKKKKKSSKLAEPIINRIPNIDILSPREMVANAIRLRQEAMSKPPGWLVQESSLPEGWREARDLNSNKIYYYHQLSGQRQWEKPSGSVAEALLPEGWSVAKDASTGKDYFYHINGETKWDRPT